MDLKFYTVPEVAQIVRLSRARIYEAVRVGLLPAVHIGRQVRIEEQAFIGWVRQGGATTN